MSRLNVLCVSVCRSSLVGDSKNVGSFFSGLFGFSELETVCGALLCSQPHLSHPLQAAHARKPKVPHGGILKSTLVLMSAGRFLFFSSEPSLWFLSCLSQAAREKEATHVFRLMFELNMWGKGKEFPVWTKWCSCMWSATLDKNTSKVVTTIKCMREMWNKNPETVNTL